MRLLYRPVWEGVQSSLRDIFVDGWPADKVIQRHLKTNRKWGSHDRKMFAESVYDIVRWWRKLLFVCDVEWPKEDKWTSREPDTFHLVVEAWCLIHDVEMDKLIPQRGLNARSGMHLWNDPSVPRAVRESVPDWLDAWGAAQLGEKWDEILPTLNTSAPVYLRANRLKTTAPQLLAALKSDRVEAQIADGDCIQLDKRANVFLSKNFKLGHFEVQDGNSQKVAPALQAQPGERVIDACAGAGGKTLHLAALMQNKGKIIALDVTDKKLEQLRERSTRAGATLIETRVIESSKTIKRLRESADRLLLDVPCSGLGILRRNPDSKWKLSPAEISQLTRLQGDILQNYAQMVKPGGTMVYATCSVSPQENLTQLEKFMSQNETKWKLEESQTLWPVVNGPDGFFLARLTKS